MDAALDLTPIFNRELLIATRKTTLWGTRGLFAGLLLTIILATFGARFYWDRGQFSNYDMMARVAFQAFAWMVFAHMAVIFGVFAARAAPSIALEKDRRTLRLLARHSAEQCRDRAGQTGGVHDRPRRGIRRRIADHAALAYAGRHRSPADCASLRRPHHHGVFHDRAGHLGLDRSEQRPPRRRRRGCLWCFAWMSGPFLVSMIFTRAGLRLPRSVLTANAWILASSPLCLVMPLVGRRHAFKRAFVCRCPDVRSASRRRRPAGALGHRSAAVGLSAQRQRR